jgi:hypothetical protein
MPDFDAYCHWCNTFRNNSQKSWNNTKIYKTNGDPSCEQNNNGKLGAFHLPTLIVRRKGSTRCHNEQQNKKWKHAESTWCCCGVNWVFNQAECFEAFTFLWGLSYSTHSGTNRIENDHYVLPELLLGIFYEKHNHTDPMW